MELIKLTFIFWTVIFPQSDGAAFAHCLRLEQSLMGAVVVEPNTALSKTDDPTFTQTHKHTNKHGVHLWAQTPCLAKTIESHRWRHLRQIATLAYLSLTLHETPHWAMKLEALITTMLLCQSIMGAVVTEETNKTVVDNNQSVNQLRKLQLCH